VQLEKSQQMLILLFRELINLLLKKKSEKQWDPIKGIIVFFTYKAMKNEI